MAAVIETQNLAVAFGGGHEPSLVFRHLNLEIEQGELVTLVGVSGAGKSTLLRVIADLIPAYEGTIRVDAAEESARRAIAMVFQAPLLMPWRRIADNVALGLEEIGVPKSERRERVRQMLELVDLADYGERWPYQLSGGQRQRVGIARALAVDPDVLLMDEPFGALDAITRSGLQDELLRIWQETRKSILFVTHDIEEAVYLGDRVLLLGGKPAEIVAEYPVAIDRARRRGGEAFLQLVEEVKAGLAKAMVLDNSG